MSTPKWTVLYNSYTKAGLFRLREFFYDEASAKVFFDKKNEEGFYPTKRPFHETDRVHLGD